MYYEIECITSVCNCRMYYLMTDYRKLYEANAVNLLGFLLNKILHVIINLLTLMYIYELICYLVMH